MSTHSSRGLAAFPAPPAASSRVTVSPYFAPSAPPARDRAAEQTAGRLLAALEGGRSTVLCPSAAAPATAAAATRAPRMHRKPVVVVLPPPRATSPKSASTPQPQQQQQQHPAMTLTAQRMWGGGARPAAVAARLEARQARAREAAPRSKQPRCSADACARAALVVEDAVEDIDESPEEAAGLQPQPPTAQEMAILEAVAAADNGIEDDLPPPKPQPPRKPSPGRAPSTHVSVGTAAVAATAAAGGEEDGPAQWRRPEGFVVVDGAAECALLAQRLDACDTGVVAVLLASGATSFRPHAPPTTSRAEGEDDDEEKVLGIACLADTHPVPFFVPLCAGSDEASKGLQTLEAFLGSGARTVCYDAQQLWRVLPRPAHTAAATVLDCRLAAWVLDPDTPAPQLAFAELVFRRTGAAELPGRPGPAQLRADLHNCRALGARLAADVRAARLHRGLAAETALAPVLAAMERAGCAFAPAVLAAGRARLCARLEQISAAAARVVGAPVALASPRQVAHAVYDVLRLAPPAPGTAGARHASTSEAALTALARRGTSPFPALVLDYRHCQKLLSTYIVPFEERAAAVAKAAKAAKAAAAHTGEEVSPPQVVVLHCQWRQTGTGTGRLSCAHPNLQTIPRGVVTFQPLTPDQDAFAVNVRDAFVCRAGAVFVVADYSQIELRVLAHFSRDQHLLASFHSGVDFHRIVAARVNGKAPAAVTSDERSRAKRVVFGVLYGMGTTKLSQVLNVPYREAERWKQSFFSNFKGVQEFMTTTIAEARKNKSVRTLLGRRRLVPNIDSSSIPLRTRSERQAVNAVIQGSAADIMKSAMVRMAARLPEHNARLVLQIHDEVEAPVHEADAVSLIVKDCMENPFSENVLAVPIPVKLSTGFTLGSLKETAGPVSESLEQDDDPLFSYGDSDVEL